jgi:hypothetical protein
VWLQVRVKEEKQMREAIGWECQQALEKRGWVRVAVSA